MPLHDSPCTWPQEGCVCVDLIILTVKDRVHLAKIMRRLKELAIVLKITRVKG